MSCCIDCKGKLVYDEYETYCEVCGLIADDSPVNFGQENNNPEKAEITSRTGAPTTYLNPEIGSTFKPWEKNKNLRKN